MFQVSSILSLSPSRDPKISRLKQKHSICSINISPECMPKQCGSKTRTVVILHILGLKGGVQVAIHFTADLQYSEVPIDLVTPIIAVVVLSIIITGIITWTTTTVWVLIIAGVVLGIITRATTTTTVRVLIIACISISVIPVSIFNTFITTINFNRSFRNILWT